MNVISVVDASAAVTADPNTEADWCPGRNRPNQGRVRYCLGVPFASGAMYAQSGRFGAGGPPFGPWSWSNGASCMAWVGGS